MGECSSVLGQFWVRACNSKDVTPGTDVFTPLHFDPQMLQWAVTQQGARKAVYRLCQCASSRNEQGREQCTIALSHCCNSLCPCPTSEPENIELRQFISRLDARINAQAMAAKRESKYQDANKVMPPVDRWVSSTVEMT
eukprot:1153471-Pelagomonas_calceolata.AAC.10